MVKVKNNHCMVTETPEFSLWSHGQMENLYSGHGQNFLPFDHDNFEILDMITFKLKQGCQVTWKTWKSLEKPGKRQK